MKAIDFNKEQKISYCVTTALRDEQIKINIKKVSGRIGEPAPEDKLSDEPVAIVCFGPSLQNTWPALEKFKKIMTCSGAHKFLIEKGIIPTWHLDLEPREHKIQMLGTPHKDVEYLIASTVHPRYFDQLKGFNVKLWHIFANDEEAVRVLPKGEWALTGGSSVGLRCLAMARYLGYTNLHIFGMDGSMKPDASHTTDHPNKPPLDGITIYEGKEYITTDSILYCAKETFKELNQMPDVKATFYGEGLVQDMSINYVPQHKHGIPLAFNRPELISKERAELNKKLHEDNPMFGMGGSKYVKTVMELSEKLKTTSILDYGCGKGMLAKGLPFSIWEYDPAIDEKKTIPRPADIVVCTDVLEHIEPDKLKFVLNDLARCVQKIGFFVISTRLAVKTYANGDNTHSIVQGKEWWNKQLSKHFQVDSIIDDQKKAELHIVVSPKKTIQAEVTTVELNGMKASFFTPNETTKFRAKSLFTKEPATIDWIRAMKPNEVLYDVGANIGSYSVVAGLKGVRVFSFEPEASNYAMLIKNLNLNGLTPNAYCLAISDEEKAGLLYAGQDEIGGACHSFGAEIGHDLKHREAVFTQACLGMPLDNLINKGFPAPDHIKIDVDGLEHKVIKGASHILENGLKSLLVELNNNIHEHIKTIEYLESLGFEYDPAQVEKAERREGPFKGCAEYVFYKRKNNSTPALKHIVKKINDTQLRKIPFNFLYAENIFPEAVYKSILANMETVEYEEIEKTRGLKGYPKRFTATPKDKFWLDLHEQLLSGDMKQAILNKFGIVDNNFKEDILLIRDMPGYSIPPHTDSIEKIISVLFYLPYDNSISNEGTSIFIPKDLDFTCRTGKHYNFDGFNKVWTAPFKPNSVLMFARTDNSFHGVEPCEHVRNVLLYNIRVR